jgi:type I restriction enzyme M protein
MAYGYDGLIARDKVNLDLTFLRDSADVGGVEPDVIAQEIVEELEAALAEFSAITESLRALKSSRRDERGAE